MSQKFDGLMNATEYKEFHEKYLENNNGTTAVHVFLCIFFTVQSSIYVSMKTQFSSKLMQYIYEYFVIVLPMILAHTLLSQQIKSLNLLVFILLLYQVLKYRSNATKKFLTKNVFENNRIPLISILRGLTYLITGLCILAIDFKDFPVQLGKTERFGFSLMDTGVGLFIAMSGLVHKDLNNLSITDIFKDNVKIVTILVVLGFGRFISVKFLVYQEHVTEYGVHWNFFFTIAVCKVLSTVLLCISNHALILSIGTLIVHEVILYHGLKDWVFSDAPRDTLLSANREGISSSLGFVSIYLYAVYIKYVLLNKNVTKFRTLKTLLQGSVVLFILYSWNFVSLTSRTVSNASYCIFINTLLTTISTVMYFIYVLCEEPNIHLPVILSMINSNGLIYFLISNLLTGVVNLSCYTLFMSSMDTFVILNVYMIVSIVLVEFLGRIGIKI